MKQGSRNRIVGLPVWRTALALVRPQSVLGRRIQTTLGVAILGGLAFLVGRSIGLSSSVAQGPGTIAPSTAPSSMRDLYDPNNSSTAGRVVAYIYDTDPIYREELAEYLIARFGAERLEFLVNRIIIERACKAKGIFVTEAQIEAQFREDLKGIGNGITAEIFQKEILSRYKKTLFEWKEDVIRPKLMLAGLCRPMVRISEADIQEGFEARYGPKVQCRMILFKAENKNQAAKVWETITSSSDPRAEFLKQAAHQADARLGSVNGQIPPIHQHFGDSRVEREAFRLRPGEISQVVEMSDGTAILLLCEQHIAAETLRRIETERIAIERDMTEIRLAEKMNEYLQELKRAARPRLLLGRHSVDQIGFDAERELKQGDPNFRSIRN